VVSLSPGTTSSIKSDLAKTVRIELNNASIRSQPQTYATRTPLAKEESKSDNLLPSKNQKNYCTGSLPASCVVRLAGNFGSDQNFGAATFCLLPVNHLPVFKANPTPLKRIVGLPYGGKIKSVGPLIKTDGVEAVWKSERDYIQVVHEFMAKRGQDRLARSPLLFHRGSRPESNFCKLDMVVAKEFMGQAPLSGRMRPRPEQS
jgi:hypothetical protein